MAYERRSVAEIRAEQSLWQLQMDIFEREQRERIRAGCPKGWERVERDHPTRPRKVPISLRIDKDVAKWFWQQGEGYQARMNAVLRAYMLARQAKMV